jgi:hypothetical protein
MLEKEHLLLTHLRENTGSPSSGKAGHPLWAIHSLNHEQNDVAVGVRRGVERGGGLALTLAGGM